MASDDAQLLVPAREIERMRVDFAGSYDPLSIQLFFSIRSLARRINDAASAWLRPFGLTATKYNYLAVLYANRATGMSPTQIGAVVHTVGGTVTSMIGGLERDKLVKRSEHRSDRRSAIIRLTARGERVFHQAALAHHAHIAAVAGELGAGAESALLDLVLQLGSSLHAHVKLLDSPGPGD
jgi:DNA-binding MarR family transcriptional regulator